MNINVRFTMVMTLAITSTLIATVAKVHAQSVKKQVQPLSTKISPNLGNKVDILRPSNNSNPAATEQERFKLFGQFRDNKPGWIEVKKGDHLRQEIINPVLPSAIDTFQKIGH